MAGSLQRARDLAAQIQRDYQRGSDGAAKVRQAVDAVNAILHPTTPAGVVHRPHVALLYMQLGDMQYEVAGPIAGIESTAVASYAEHAVVVGRPRLQRIGEELEMITLSLELHTGYCDPAFELARLRTAKAIGDAMPLLFANGQLRGRFVITQLDETHNRHTGLGDPISVSVRVALKEWVEDQTVEVASRRKRAAAAAVQPQQRTTATKAPANAPAGDPHTISPSAIIRGR